MKLYDSLLVIVTIFITQNTVETKNSVTVDFITKFIENEQKQTYFIYKGLCWKKHALIKLVNQISMLRIRTSASLEPRSRYQDHTILFLIDLDCDESVNVIQQAISKKLFQLAYRWLVLGTQRSNRSHLWNSPLLVDSDLVLAEWFEDHFKLVELHKTSHNASLQSTVRGYYNGCLVDLRPHRELFRRRRNLGLTTLTMSNVIQDSNTTKYHLPREDRLELQYDAVSKTCWSTSLHAYEMLNATPRYIFTYRYGFIVDGKWTGLIGDLAYNKADFGTNCLIFEDRTDVVTYTDFVASMKMYFIFRQPPLVYVSNVFYLPFSSSVWMTTLVCTAIATFALFVASKWEASIEKSSTQLDGGFGDTLLLTVSAVTQQGSSLEPRRIPGRMIMWVLFTALMALFVAYSANIVVLLQSPSKSITNLQQLDSAKITLAALDTDYNHFVLNRSNDPLLVAIRDKVFPKGEKPLLYNLSEGVERIRKGLFAMHASAEPVFKQISATFQESEKCDVSQVDYMNSFESFIPLKKGSPYLELIRVVFKQIRESGIQSAIRKRYLTERPRCTNAVSAFSSVGLLDLRPVLIIMLYGVCLSVIIAAAEIVVFNLQKRHKVISTKRMKIRK